MDCLSDENEQIEVAEGGALEQHSDLKALYRYFAISPDDSAKYRMNALHLIGVSEMSTLDIEMFLEKFSPFRIEWINDNSCNVVFESEETAAQCMMAIGSPPENDDGACSSAEFCWVAYHPNGYQLLIRFAELRDVKCPKAYVRSKYFRLHGNPRLGGIRGFVSKEMKRKILQDPALLEKIKRLERGEPSGLYDGAPVGDQETTTDKAGGKIVVKRSHGMRMHANSVEEHKAEKRRSANKQPHYDLRQLLESKRAALRERKEDELKFANDNRRNRLDVGAAYESSSFLQATFHMCSLNLTQWEEAFRGLDTNGNGVVTPRDISVRMMRLGIPHSIDDLAFAVREIAGDGSEEVDFNTLIPLFTYQAEAEEDTVELRETFNIFDRNGDGYITTTELKQVLDDLGDPVSDEDVRNIIASTDSDQDGLINFEDNERKRKDKLLPGSESVQVRRRRCALNEAAVVH
ncbi:hypothetical protein M513_10836 [Trichuris suis]|uniref:Nuclear cap-binding protein subunit 3 n=1 Tax=Trichuris suis TaxID=68888 RepID=A0A085LTG3_9BILA|nr:hypothetical protein M513_10836 [Trichuris suis]